ncbi:MAG: hypothetical protein RRZ65_10250, partial [Tannerellaceae bacterium]
MKKLVCFAIALVFVGCSSVSNKKDAPKEPANNAISQEVFVPEENGYKLVWEDGFNGTELDTTKWKIRGNGARRIGYNDASMVKVENGNLLLMYDVKADSIMGCAVGTADTYQTHFGYFECRAKVQKGN